MNWWQKLRAGLKFVFGGFESAADYVLEIVNGWVEDSGFREDIIEYDRRAMAVLAWLRSHADWCPPKWRNEYAAVCAAMECIVDAAEDGFLTSKEISSVIDCWRTAVAKWNEED